MAKNLSRWVASGRHRHRWRNPRRTLQQSKEAFLLECLIDATEQAAALRKELAEHRQRLHDLEQIVLHLAEVTR